MSTGQVIAIAFASFSLGMNFSLFLRRIICGRR